jgi:ABC-type glycerol-3-phosphate transport system substrate-binding protein
MVIAVPVAALLLVAAGCGGSSDSSAGDSTATIESTDTSNGTDTGASTDATDTNEDASLGGCPELADLSAKFTEALGAATGGSSMPDLEEVSDVYEEFADEAPEEIRDAVRTFAAAFAAYAEAVKDVDFKPGEAPDPETLEKLGEAAKAFDDPELTEATAEIEAWVKENCTTG